MSFFSLFNSAKSAESAPAAAPAPAPAAPAAPAPAAGVDQQGNAIPAASAAPSAPAEVNPLDQLNALFAQDTNAPSNTAPTLSFSPERVGEVSASMNFADGLDPAVLEAFQGGDPAAMMNVMQHMARQAFQQGVLANSQMINHQSGQLADYAINAATTTARSQVIGSQLNAAELSPTAQNMLRGVATKIAASNPNLSSAEIQSQSIALIQGLANEFNLEGKRASNAAAQQVEQSSTDWASVFSQTN